MLDFIHGIFDIRFIEDVTIDEAELYVYDNEIKNLYEKDGYVWLKVRVDMRKILGRFIGEIGVDYFVVYNKNQKGIPIDCVYNLDEIHQENEENLDYNSDDSNYTKEQKQKRKYTESSSSERSSKRSKKNI